MTPEFRSNRPRVLCVDDEQAFGKALVRLLNARGWTAEWCDSAMAGLEALEARPYDVVILDWKMPGLSGAAACRTFRARFPEMPILILTAGDETSDRLAAFEAGANDYVLKNTHPDELSARLRDRLNRSSSEAPRVASSVSEIRYGSMKVRLSPRRVEVEGERVRCTPKEADFLVSLVAAEGKFVSCAELASALFEQPPANPEGRLKSLASQLRTKLVGTGIEIVRSKGAYRLRVPAEGGGDRSP